VFDRRFFLGVLATLVLLEPLVARAEPVRVALLPIVVHSSAGESGYLSDGIVAMLAARLEQKGGIQVIRMQSNAGAVSTPDAAVEAARGGDAEFVVFGSFTQFGSGASLDLRCARVAGGSGHGQPPARQVFIESGDLGEIIPQLDDLAGRIALYVKEGAPAPAAVASGEAAAGPSLADLERRVERLEQEVLGGAEAPEAGPSSGAD